MTKLTSSNTPLTRRTAVDYRGRSLVVTLHPGVLIIKRLGVRSEGFSIGYDTIYECAARMYAMSARAAHDKLAAAGKRKA